MNEVNPTSGKMQRSCVSLFVAVLLIAGAVSEQSPQAESLNTQKLTELLDSPPASPPDVLQPFVKTSTDSRDAKESQLEPSPISKIKGRLLTPEEGCGFSNVTNTKIIGGQEAKQGAWPWMALLGYRVNSSRVAFRCGGSLITSRHVLTAAHCLHPDLSFVRLGEHDTRTSDDGPTQNVKVVRTEKHNYNELDKTNDIAILYLDRDVNFTERVRPICLPVTEPIRNESFVKRNPFVAGWGILKENGTTSPVLHQVQLRVRKNSVYKKVFNKTGHLYPDSQFSDKIICAGERYSGKDNCRGDSGGPLMLPLYQNGEFPFYQIGIVSNGLVCGYAASIYTNVAFHADWILEKLKI